MEWISKRKSECYKVADLLSSLPIDCLSSLDRLSTHNYARHAGVHDGRSERVNDSNQVVMQTGFCVFQKLA